MTEQVDESTGEIIQEDGEQEAPGALVLHEATRAELERRRDVAGVLRPVESPAQLLEAHEASRGLIAEVLKDGRDYGHIPGTKKDEKRLLQPGAHRIAQAYGCQLRSEIVEKEADHDREVRWEKKKKRWKGRQFDGWDVEAGTSVGMYRYVARAELVHRASGVVVGEGWGVCSSLEDRYVDRPRDLEHTIQAMSRKRAEVDAVLTTFALRGQFLDEAEVREHREDLTPEELLKIARGRYYAVLAEEQPHEGIRELMRHAFQEAHPKLPDSTSEWEIQHFQRALNEWEKFGFEIVMDRAVAGKAKREPADQEDAAALDQAIEGRELSDAELDLVTWVRWAGVASWVRQLAAELAGPQPEGGQEAPDPDELEQQAAEARDEARGGRRTTLLTERPCESP